MNRALRTWGALLVAAPLAVVMGTASGAQVVGPRASVDPPVAYSAYRGLPAVYSLMEALKSSQNMKTIPSSVVGQLAGEPNSTYFKDCTATSGPYVCVFGSPKSKVTLVVAGDSWAEEWIPALNQLGVQKHFRVVAYMRDGCNMATGTFYDTTAKGVDTQCAPFRTAAITAINSMSPKPAMVIISEARYWYNPDQSWASDAEWASAVKTTVAAIHSAKVAVTFGEALSAPGPAQCLSINLTNVAACNTPLSAQKSATDFGVAGIKAAHALPIGLRIFMCGSTCPDIVATTLIHSDAYHVSTAFSTYATAALGQILGCGASLGYSNAVTLALRGPTSSAQHSACTHYLASNGEY